MEDCPAIVTNIVLFNAIDSTTSFISPKNINVSIFKDYSWHSTSLLVEFCDWLPPINRNAVSFTAFKYTINTPSTDCIHIISLMSQSVSVPALEEVCFFSCDFFNRVEHKNLARYVCKRWIKTSSDQYTSIIQSNSICIRL
jgi:hypothetical protein